MALTATTTMTITTITAMYMARTATMAIRSRYATH